MMKTLTPIGSGLWTQEQMFERLHVRAADPTHPGRSRCTQGATTDVSQEHSHRCFSVQCYYLFSYLL